MSLFIIGALVMVVLALAFLLPPLLGRGNATGIARDSLNVVLFKDRLAELKQELEEGTLSPDQYDQACNELRRDLLATSGGDEAPTGPMPSGRWAAAATALAVPILAFAIYFQIGSPHLLGDRPINAPTGEMAQGDVIAMVEQLAQRLEQDPDNLEGWVLLGRSLMALDRYADAAHVFRRANDLAGGSPELLSEQAEALALASGGDLDGRPIELIREALALDGDSPGALWLSGVHAAQQGNLPGAITAWERLLGVMSPDDPSAEMILGNLEQARAQLQGAPVSMEAPVGAVAVEVALAPGLEAAPDAAVFIFATAPQGPPMPLAAERVRVRDLPMTVQLTAMAEMGGDQPLADYPQLVFTARIALSGDVRRVSGDLEGTVTAAPGDTPVRITIDSRVP